MQHPNFSDLGVLCDFCVDEEDFFIFLENFNIEGFSLTSS